MTENVKAAYKEAKQELQTLLKPGSGQPGIALGIPDAKVNIYSLIFSPGSNLTTTNVCESICYQFEKPFSNQSYH